MELTNITKARILLNCGHFANPGDKMFLVPKDIRQMYRFGIGENEERICKKCNNSRFEKIYSNETPTLDLFK